MSEPGKLSFTQAMALAPTDVEVSWSGPDDYDPSDDDLVALIAQIKEDTGRAVSEWIGANFGAGVQARFEREFPLPCDEIGPDEL